MKFIPNWQNEILTCHFCGEKRSVKYTVELNEKEVACCNKYVMLIGAFRKIREETEKRRANDEKQHPQESDL
jgi:hypothetical protein